MKKVTLLPNQFRTEINVSSNDEARTVDLIWSTGYKGLRQGWGGKYYEELSLNPSHVDMSRLRAGAPVLAAHSSWSLDSVIGVVERAEVDGKIGTATIRFAKDEFSEQIYQKIKDKILRNVSVGYRVHKYEDVSDKGDEIRTYRAVNWTPMEISIVPIAFDNGAKIRKEEETLTENEVEIISPRSLTDEVRTMSKETQPEVSQPIDTEALKREAVQAEITRSKEIRKYVREAGLSEQFADELFERKLSLDEAKLHTDTLKRHIDESKKTTEIQPTTRIEVGADDRDKKRDALAQVLLNRVDPINFKLDNGNPVVGYSLMRAFETMIPRRPGEYDTQYAKRVMSSSDLPFILANTMEKSAQKKYELQPRTWSRWASTRTLRNYKTHDSVRSGDFSSLEERQEGGEFKRGSFGEEREQVALKDWGKIMPFTRRMLINDDLNEIVKVSSQTGVAASRLENKLVYDVLKNNAAMGDGVVLFHATHANLGTAGAISDTTIGEAFKLMRKQLSVDGEDKLNLAPKYLITGPENEVQARKYLAQISPTEATNVNVFSNSLELIIDAEISNDDFFFAADQNVIETVVLCHLEGEEQPRVESRIDFETESVEIKVAHAANSYAADYRGLVKNAGPT